ncbi:MAG: amino acid ABC transporter permease [Anaerolineaceae bacterium]|nr:amino acid ABC transporter permease [Anaerolineaceae bacterium]
MTDFLQTLILGLMLGGVYALFAGGLTLVFGVMRIVNIAHPAFIFLAAFIAYTLNKNLGLDPLVAVLFNMPIMFVFGMGIYRLLLAKGADSPRYTQMTVLITFGLALMIEGILSFLFTGTIRSVNPPYAVQAIFIGDIFIPRAQLYAGITSLILIGLLALVLRYTRIGYAIRATMQNRAAARTVGVNVERVSTIAFGIGAALAGASGALMSFLFSFFPSGHWEWVALLLSLVVLGGMGQLMGAVVGALSLAVAAAFVSDTLGPTWSPLTFYLSLFVILLIRPQGLFGKKMEAE